MSFSFLQKVSGLRRAIVQKVEDFAASALPEDLRRQIAVAKGDVVEAQAVPPEAVPQPKPVISDQQPNIVQHIRRRNGRRIGTLAAAYIEGQVVVGWSKCRPTDKFSSTLGVQSAMGRILAASRPSVMATHIPNGVREHLPHFTDRAKRYFKVQEVVVTGI